MQDHRSIPLDVLREFVRSQAEITSVRAVAQTVGVGRTTLHNFLYEGTTPHPRIRRLLGLWYIAEHNKPPDFEVVRPYVSALSILVSTLPTDQQGTARALLVDDLCALHGEPLPRWLQLLKGTE